MEGQRVLLDAAKTKNGRILQKEVPLFLKKKRKTRNVDSPVIDLRFGKIGVDGESGRYGRSDFVKQVESRFEVERLATS